MFAEQVTITQRINVSRWAANKKHNLRLAVATFQNLPIHPGEIFSFWFYVGRPTEKAGYRVGINIIQGKLDFDVGGGLCQLSGLLYHLALAAGLEILERHPHSVDLYTDETRYTPLGADATTAFGYKDLRLKNSLDTPVCFRISIEDQSLVGSVCALKSLEAQEVIFRKEVLGRTEVVETLRKTTEGEYRRLCTQTYTISDHDQVI
jgi:vancomycin resistance protein VanW